MALRSSVEKIACVVCGEAVLSCRNRNYVLAGKMLVLSRRLRETQGMDRSYLIIT